MSDEQIAHLGRRSTEFNVGEQVPGTPYLVVSRIGQGGMGSVYEVEHRELGKRFVLKALLDQFCQREDLVQRLRNEWRSLGRLEHPNIVSVSDAGMATNGAPFYVMERLQGESLAGALARLGRLSLLDSLRLAAEVLEGLAAAHEIGIVHRDVKPPNIFITHTGSAKLLDFGIAKLTDGASLELTGRGIAIGTPRYMSPEQAAGEKVDGRADLYAVGLVLFEMLCGTGPFDGCESHEVFLAHITRQPPRLSELIQGIPPELDGLVASLLAKRPHERPQSAGVAASLLRSMLRTYRSLESMPDTQAAELEGVMTPLVQGEFVAPVTPGHAPVVGLGPYPVSGNGPTASVSQVPPLFPASSERGGFATPPLMIRASTPPGFERRGRGSVPPNSGAARSWHIDSASAPSTRTAHPEAATAFAGHGYEPQPAHEATPSGLWHSNPSGSRSATFGTATPERKFPLALAVGGVFGAAVLGARLIGGPNDETKATGAPLASDAPLVLEAPSASVLVPKPEATRGGDTGASAAAANAAGAVASETASSLVKAEAEADPAKPKPRVKTRVRDVANTDLQSAVEPAERPPVVRPALEKVPAPSTDNAKPDTPPTPLTTERPQTPNKKPPRLPTSGIGGL